MTVGSDECETCSHWKLLAGHVSAPGFRTMLDPEKLALACTPCRKLKLLMTTKEMR